MHVLPAGNAVQVTGSGEVAGLYEPSELRWTERGNWVQTVTLDAFLQVNVPCRRACPGLQASLQCCHVSTRHVAF